MPANRIGGSPTADIHPLASAEEVNGSSSHAPTTARRRPALTSLSSELQGLIGAVGGLEIQPTDTPAIVDAPRENRTQTSAKLSKNGLGNRLATTQENQHYSEINPQLPSNTSSEKTLEYFKKQNDNLKEFTLLTPPAKFLIEKAKIGDFEIITQLLDCESQAITDENINTALKEAIFSWKNGKGEALFSALQLISLPPDIKFKFKYQSNNPSDKLIEEDEYANSVLKSEKSRESIFTIGSKLSNFLEKNITSESMKQEFINSLNGLMSYRRGSYPLPAKDFKNFSELTYLLNSKEKEADSIYHVKMISIMWIIPRYIRKNVFNTKNENLLRLKKTRLKAVR